MSDYPADLAYSKDHAWAKISGNQGTVGITKFASEQLGDIMTVSFDVKPGDTVAAGTTFGTIESVKALSDLYTPLGGKIVAVNSDLIAHPELVNEDCYGKGWMIVIELSDSTEAASLLDTGGYRKHVQASG
jgi:glycine cleavage system H protein